MLTNYQGERQPKDTNSEMTQTLELSYIDFTTTIIIMSQELQQTLWKLLEDSQSQWIETIMQKQIEILELNNTKTDIKHLLGGLKPRWRWQRKDK